MIENEVYKEIVVLIASFIEAAGIFAMVAGIILAMIGYFWRLLHKADIQYGYHVFRSNIGRSILLGLELLVGADIIKTVAMEPTMQSALTLGVIVIIRTILSIALQVEVNGYWPWEEAKYKYVNKV